MSGRPPPSREQVLTDEEWEQIVLLLPKPAKRGPKRSADLREVLNAIRYIRLPSVGFGVHSPLTVKFICRGCYTSEIGIPGTLTEIKDDAMAAIYFYFVRNRNPTGVLDNRSCPTP